MSEEDVHRGDYCDLKYGTVGDLIRSSNGQDAAKISQAEGMQGALLPSTDGPALAAVK